jgi:hypothetical protein
MSGLPKPEPGLVISYSYLWSDEAARGQVEGRKDRPCAILVTLLEGSRTNTSPRVVVVPITHRPASDPTVAIEIPARVQQHLGLDTQQSWVIVNDFNVFTWPGFDLRTIRRGERRVHYGFLPPKLFDQIIARFRELRAQTRCQGTSRE